jgi:2-polyprenyl-3-methyl-5-hydroxy-6-metoxy-1,4-benzoquinol methylase
MSYFINRERCPVCNDTAFTELVKLPYTHPYIVSYFNRLYSKYKYPDINIDYNFLEGANYWIVECKTCGLIFHKEVANDLVMFKIYEEWSDIEHNFQINLNNHTPHYVFNHLNEVFHLLSLYNNKSADKYKVLDFGAGWSQWCRVAIAFGLDVYGHELSIAKKKFAEKFGIKMIGWEQLPEHQFDFINTEQVFEHLTNPLETLEYLKKCTHSESIIKISVPNSIGLKDFLKSKIEWDQISDSGVFNAIAPLQHINAFTRDNLVRMIDSAGFSIIPSQKTPYLTIVNEKNSIKKIKTLIKSMLNAIKIFISVNKQEIDTSTYMLIKRK